VSGGCGGGVERVGEETVDIVLGARACAELQLAEVQLVQGSHLRRGARELSGLGCGLASAAGIEV